MLDDYKPKSDLIDIETLKTSENFKKKRYIDALYFGEMSDKM